MDEKTFPGGPNRNFGTGGMTPSQPGGETGNRITERAAEIAGAGLEEAKNLTATAKERVYREVDTRKQTVAGKLESFASDLERMAGQAGGGMQDEESMEARLKSNAARRLRSLSRTLNESSTEELVNRAGQKIRQRPGMFLAACLAVGFLGGRLLRGSR